MAENAGHFHLPAPRTAVLMVHMTLQNEIDKARRNLLKRRRECPYMRDLFGLFNLSKSHHTLRIGIRNGKNNCIQKK